MAYGVSCRRAGRIARSSGRQRAERDTGAGGRCEADSNELAVAKQRIAELERKVGQQALEADFFRQALQLFETSRGPSDRPGGTASMASSRPGRGSKAAKVD